MSIADYLTNGLGKLQDNLFQVDPNVASSMSADQLKGARQNALLHLGLGILAGNRNGNGLGRAALLGLSDAENSFGQQTQLSYALNRQKQQDAEAGQARALQMAALTAPGLGRLAGGLDAAPDKNAAWHSIIGNSANQALLHAAGIDPATVTPDKLPALIQQMHQQADLYTPPTPIEKVGAGDTLWQNGKPLYTAPPAPEKTNLQRTDAGLTFNPADGTYKDSSGRALSSAEVASRETTVAGQKAAAIARANAAAQGMTGFGAAADAATKAGVTGDEFLKTLPQTQANIVKALADGRMNFPAGFALKSPYWQQMISAVSQYDPSFDAVNFNARSSTRKDFTSGKSAQNIKALNTAIGHLGTLVSQIPGTASHALTWFNAAENAALEATGHPGPALYKQTAGALASELTTVFRGSGGAEADVKRYLDELNGNGSKAQKIAAANNIAELLASRTAAIGDQYNKGMGKTSDPLALLDSKAQGVLANLRSGGDAASGPTIQHHSGATIQLLP